jgi:hypothetical protein
MAESQEERAALDKLDDETREVAWDELGKEADRERNGPWWGRGPLALLGRPRPFHRVKADPEPEPVDDEDPGGEQGLRDALRDRGTKS